MLNSRDVGRLRVDVMQNCLVLLQLCLAEGLPVLVTGTVRDDEFQLQCYKKGTGGKPPATFHSVKAGLAFDVCKNVKGQEYADAAFFARVGAIGKRLGFTWGGDWKSVDKPHFQWDQYGRYTGRDIIAGRLPPMMPLAAEGEDRMTEAQVKLLVKQEVDQALAESDAVVTERSAKVAPWAQEAWLAAKEAGVFDGTRPGAGLSRQEAALTYQRLGLLGGEK